MQKADIVSTKEPSLSPYRLLWKTFAFLAIESHVVEGNSDAREPQTNLTELPEPLPSRQLHLARSHIPVTTGTKTEK